MPKIQWPITDTDQTVTRPVAIGIVEEMKQYTDMPEGVPILFTGPDGKTYQPGSSINKDDLANQVRGQTYNQLTIEVDEQYEHDAYLTTPVEHPEHLFVFRDDYLDTYIKPAYSSMDVTINVRFRAQDKTTAERWRSQMKMKIGRGKLVNLHTVTYSYFIPPVMLARDPSVAGKRRPLWSGLEHVFHHDGFTQSHACHRSSWKEPSVGDGRVSDAYPGLLGFGWCGGKRCARRRGGRDVGDYGRV